MLVLQREAGENIVITLKDGTEINVMVCRVSGDAVKIGIEAPRHIRIDRDHSDQVPNLDIRRPERK